MAAGFAPSSEPIQYQPKLAQMLADEQPAVPSSTDLYVLPRVGCNRIDVESETPRSDEITLAHTPNGADTDQALGTQASCFL